MTELLGWQRLALSQIQYGSNWMEQHLRGIEAAIRNLPNRPEFTSENELALENLEDVLTDMLSRVRSLQIEYRSKPIYTKPIDVDLREDMRLLSLDAAE